MLNNTINSFFDEYENIYNCITGKEISEDEMKQINNFIDFDFNDIHNKNCHSIHNFFIYKDKIFKIDESIKFNKLKYEIVEKTKKKYYKFEDDETLYIKNFGTYIYSKKELFSHFKILSSLVYNKLDDSIKDYLLNNYFSNINKCNFYDCLKWFNCIFIYYLHSILEPEIFNYKIDYINFRKYILKYRRQKKGHDITKEIFIKFKTINFNFKYYEELKALLNFSIFHIFDGFYSLP